MSKTKGIDNSFTTFLRRAAKISCPLDDCGEHIDAVDNTIREHIKASHPDLLDKQDLAALVSEFRR